MDISIIISSILGSILIETIEREVTNDTNYIGTTWTD
jgi:hypothetical protein